MHIEAKTNLNLWLLTGRADGYVAPHLNTYVTYPTAAPTPAIVEARRFLKLDTRTTDFYVLGAMAAAYASMPALRELPDDNLAVFSRDLLRIPAPYVTGATLIPLDGISWPSVANHPRGVQAFTSVTFRRSGNRAVIESNDGTTSYSDFTTTDKGVIIHKAAELGIRAAFAISGGWQEGATFTVVVPPSRYPYAAFAAELLERGALIRFMSASGTMEAFASSSNPVLRVGALASAIMLESFRNTLLAAEDAAQCAELSLASQAFYANHHLSVDWLPANYESASSN